jgi:hypothetical protein
MHRSGTSAMAGLLHSNGIVMGRENDFRPRPMKENPKGFYENVHFRKINDIILRRNDYNVKSFSPSIPFIYPENHGGAIQLRMEKLIRSYDYEFKNWGWKDPRTSLTAYAWFDILSKMDLLKDLKVIYMKRDVHTIARSMRARGNKERYSEQFIDCALKYYNKCTFYLEFLDFNVFKKTQIISFEDDLLGDINGTCQRLSSFLKYDIKDTSFIDRDISKQSKKEVVNERARTYTSTSAIRYGGPTGPCLQ